jgi:hypothetical protein
MGTKPKTKPTPKAGSRAEKLIKVTPSTHRALKIQAAERDESIGELITHLVEKK